MTEAPQKNGVSCIFFGLRVLCFVLSFILSFFYVVFIFPCIRFVSASRRKDTQEGGGKEGSGDGKKDDKGKIRKHKVRR